MIKNLDRFYKKYLDRTYWKKDNNGYLVFKYKTYEIKISEEYFENKDVEKYRDKFFIEYIRFSNFMKFGYRLRLEIIAPRTMHLYIIKQNKELKLDFTEVGTYKYMFNDNKARVIVIYNMKSNTYKLDDTLYPKMLNKFVNRYGKIIDINMLFMYHYTNTIYWLAENEIINVNELLEKYKDNEEGLMDYILRVITKVKEDKVEEIKNKVKLMRL